MIKEKIRAKAVQLGVKKLGFGKGAVVALFPYFVKGEEGNLSMYARSLDYHRIAGDILLKLESFLIELGAAATKVHLDNGGLDDRKAAFDAGLGFYGQNGMLICEEYGSYFFIGQILHDLDIEPDSPMDRECLMCGRCERECPAGALRGGKVNEDRCLSAITQRRGELLQAEEELIKKEGICWGCDVCQRVCPHNRGLDTTAMEGFMKDRISHLELKDIEELTNKGFSQKYGRYAFSWRGKGPLVRNLRVLSFAEDKNGKE